MNSLSFFIISHSPTFSCLVGELCTNVYCLCPYFSFEWVCLLERLVLRLIVALHITALIITTVSEHMRQTGFKLPVGEFVHSWLKALFFLFLLFFAVHFSLLRACHVKRLPSTCPLSLACVCVSLTGFADAWLNSQISLAEGHHVTMSYVCNWSVSLQVALNQ